MFTDELFTGFGRTVNDNSICSVNYPVFLTVLYIKVSWWQLEHS